MGGTLSLGSGGGRKREGNLFFPVDSLVGKGSGKERSGHRSRFTAKEEEDEATVVATDDIVHIEVWHSPITTITFLEVLRIISSYCLFFSQSSLRTIHVCTSQTNPLTPFFPNPVPDKGPPFLHLPSILHTAKGSSSMTPFPPSSPFPLASSSSSLLFLLLLLLSAPTPTSTDAPSPSAGDQSGRGGGNHFSSSSSSSPSLGPSLPAPLPSPPPTSASSSSLSRLLHSWNSEAGGKEEEEEEGPRWRRRTRTNLVCAKRAR